MKKILLTLVAVLSVCGLFAQTTATLPLKVYVEDLPQPFPDNAKIQMINKINQMLTANGLASSDIYHDFLLTVIANPTDKVVVSGAPVQIMQSMDFTFYMVDANRQLVFSTYSTQAKGVGETETKSCMDAMKRVNIKSDEVADFLNQGRLKIIAWYDSEAENIFAKARALAHQQKFEEAFYHLCSFPTECAKYMESLEVGNQLFDEYQNYLAQINLNKARMAWAAEQNTFGAEKAGVFLAEILPNTSSYEEAVALYEEIKAKVLEDWKFEMKQYQDGVDIEKMKIDAWREVGISYGRYQQPTTTNLAWLR